jgi:hypothetical protein
VRNIIAWEKSRPAARTVEHVAENRVDRQQNQGRDGKTGAGAGRNISERPPMPGRCGGNRDVTEVRRHRCHLTARETRSRCWLVGTTPAVCDLGAHSRQKPRPAQIKAASKIKIEVNSSTHTTTTRPYLAKSKRKDEQHNQSKNRFFH